MRESGFERTRIMDVLGTPVRVKSYACAQDGGAPIPVEGQVRLQLTVIPSSWCMADCPFCIASPHDRMDSMDLKQLEKTLLMLKEADILRGVTITGGEPLADVRRVDRIVSMLFGIFGFDLEVTLDTNGCGIERLGEIRDLQHVDTVHVSRHHYDDEVNYRLFGTRAVPSAGTLKRAMHAVSYRDLFVMNCMLLRDHIGTAEEVHRYLDFAIETGAGKVSFITGTPVNAYMEQQRVEYEDVIRRDDPAFLLSRSFRDHEWCRCQDGVYCSEAGLIEFYGRRTDARGCGYCRGLVYGSDNRLRAGFGGPVIGQ